MNRKQFEKLWDSGRVRIHVDETEAFKAVLRGHLGKKRRRSLFLWLGFAGIVLGLAVAIMITGSFEYGIEGFGQGWLGALLFLLGLALPLAQRGSAAQIVRNRVIRDPKFYEFAWDHGIIGLEEY